MLARVGGWVGGQLLPAWCRCCTDGCRWLWTTHRQAHAAADTSTQFTRHHLLPFALAEPRAFPCAATLQSPTSPQRSRSSSGATAGSTG
jgi:hypothetical protein